jgi:hypothetical protein
MSAAIAIVLLAGCAAHEHLPPAEWHTEQDARRILADRASRIHNVTAQGLLTMQQSNGQSVRLDIAMVRDNAHHVRLRAWKLGRTVFDFTLTPDGVWLLMPDDPSIRNRLKQAQGGVAKLADTFGIIDGALFSDPKTKYRKTGNTITFSGSIDNSRTTCEVDSTTLTPRKYALTDENGVARFTLALDRYKVIDSIPTAMRYTATSDVGTMIVSLTDIDLNTDLAPGAFVPPHRAEKIR